MTYVVRINDKEYEVDVERGKANIANVTTIQAAAPVAVAAAPVAAAPVAAAPAASAAPADGTLIKAPMPGTILKVAVEQGQSVKQGDLLVILEAMKMENEILAPADGVVKQILTSKGASVATDAPLVVI